MACAQKWGHWAQGLEVRVLRWGARREGSQAERLCLNNVWVAVPGLPEFVREKGNDWSLLSFEGNTNPGLVTAYESSTENAPKLAPTEVG